MSQRQDKLINLAPYHLEIRADNWQRVLAEHAADRAFQTLAVIGEESAVEIAFALLETYFLTSAGKSCPFLVDNGNAAQKLETLGQILRSAHIKLTDSAVCTPVRDNPPHH